jgi:hypothetical protein
MLDPLTSLSVATSIVQFIDFSSKLVSKASELRTSATGALIENFELEAVAQHTLSLCKRLKETEEKTRPGDAFNNLFTSESAQRSRRTRINNLNTDSDQSWLQERKDQAEYERLQKEVRQKEQKLVGVQREVQEQIHVITKSCENAANELLDAVSSLKIQGKHTKWKSFRQALCVIWNQDRVDGLASRLDRLRAQLDTELLNSMRSVSI